MTEQQFKDTAENIYPLDNPKKNMFHDNSGQHSRQAAFIAGAKYILENQPNLLKISKLIKNYEEAKARVEFLEKQASAPNEKQSTIGLKWVKASERLPNFTGQYFAIYKDQKKCSIHIYDGKLIKVNKR